MTKDVHLTSPRTPEQLDQNLISRRPLTPFISALRSITVRPISNPVSRDPRAFAHAGARMALSLGRLTFLHVDPADDVLRTKSEVVTVRLRAQPCSQPSFDLEAGLMDVGSVRLTRWSKFPR